MSERALRACAEAPDHGITEMTTPAVPSRIAVLGLGAIGRRVLASMQTRLLPAASYAAYQRSAPEGPLTLRGELAHFRRLEDLLAWKPELAIECAGHAVVSLGPDLLREGVDFMVVSIGAMADGALRARLYSAARQGGSQLLTVSGAIGGLDALDAARGAGLDAVVYTGRKPAAAWQGTPASEAFDLLRLDAPTSIFEGSAGDAARLYPKNANVTAAIALAGVGFDATHVRLVADPTVTQNVHELDVRGAFGHFNIRLENNPLPDNPKTSWLAALSIEAELRRYLRVPSALSRADPIIRPADKAAGRPGPLDSAGVDHSRP